MSDEWRARWREGRVDAAAEHIELRKGSARDGAWDDWLPVARVARRGAHEFVVEFLVTGDDETARASRDAARRELDFFLSEKGEPSPWHYAIHHCGTAANVYSDIHWSYFPGAHSDLPGC